MSALTPEQYGYLVKPIDRRRVRSKQGQSHLEAWDDRRHLIRVFGFGGFNVETKELRLLHERIDNGRVTVVYLAQVRLTVKDVAGAVLAVFEDGATGDACNFPMSKLGDAHDFALKTSLSQALKRCCVNLGDQFGLSLYDEGSTVAVVEGSLNAPVASVVSHEGAVTGGELDEQAAPDAPSVPAQSTPRASGTPTPDALRAAIKTAAAVAGVDLRHIADRWQSDYDESIKDAADVERLRHVLDELNGLVKA